MATDHKIVEQNAKSGSYREVLDWLAAQVDRLDQHERELERQCAERELDASAIEIRTAQITEARNWLAVQLENALVARGLSLAA